MGFFSSGCLYWLDVGTWKSIFLFLSVSNMSCQRWYNVDDQLTGLRHMFGDYFLSILFSVKGFTSS